MSSVEYLTVWLLAVATAGWFAFLAHTYGRNWCLWASGGGVFGLIIACMVWGVQHAEFIPMSNGARALFLAKTNLIAAALIGLLGWLFTLSLHRQNLVPPPASGRR